MAPSLFADPTFPKKLGIKPGLTLLLQNAPQQFADSLAPNLPEGVAVLTEPEPGRRADMVIRWLQPGDDLSALFSALRWTVRPDGAVWAVIPKKTVAKKRGIDLTFDGTQAAALPTGLVDNKTLTPVCPVGRFSEEEYGIRYVVRVVERQNRRATSIEGAEQWGVQRGRSPLAGV